MTSLLGHPSSNHESAVDTSLYGNSLELDHEINYEQGCKTEDLHGNVISSNHLHYYVHFLNGDESTYLREDRNVEIDQQFHHQLQEREQAGDISTFLALPEIIPARQCRRQ